MDLQSVLPDFSTVSFLNIIPSLERRGITTVDLITLEPLEIAKRAVVPLADIRRLCDRIVEALHTDVGFERAQPNTELSDNALNSSIDLDTTLVPGPATKRTLSEWSTISTLDPAMDALLGGGIPTGYVTEVTGESGSGKTQFLLSLCLAVQLPVPRGLRQRAIYISTEHPLSTPRLLQLLESHPALSNLPPGQAPSLEAILSINAMDLETQDHIFNFQLPYAIKHYDIGLVVIDSITSNYRAEHSNNATSLAKRAHQLAETGVLLRKLAINENVAIVLANQVSDRFESTGGALSQQPFLSGLDLSQDEDSGPSSPYPQSQTEQVAGKSLPPSSSITQSSQVVSSPYHATEHKNFDGSYQLSAEHSPFLNLAHQERFFNGWGDGPNPDSGSLKNPALGFSWSTQIACRIALRKEVSTTMNGESSQYRTIDATGDPGSIARPVPPHAIAGPRSQLPIPSPESVTRRALKLVFCPWTGGAQDTSGGSESNELEFEIWKGGLRGTSYVERVTSPVNK